MRFLQRWMGMMDVIDSINKRLYDDMVQVLHKGSRLSFAAAYFSIYAFEKLKRELADIDELRFIFTEPSFLTQKENKEKREFYIPRLTRERSLYGTEFEIQLRNKLGQKASLAAEKGSEYLPVLEDIIDTGHTAKFLLDFIAHNFNSFILDCI